jgi:septum formation protein
MKGRKAMNQVLTKSILLASKSEARLAMISAAGVRLDSVAPMVDEDSIRASLIEVKESARNISDALAEAKAVKISRKYPGTLVIGSDQILETEEGIILSKAETPSQAREALAQLSGKTHRLYSAAVIAEAGKPAWRHVDKAKMTMRILTPGFIDSYVGQYWEEIRPCVGCYRIEAEGAQLFAKIEGSQFTIMGVPLLHVLDYLRVRGNLPS